MVSVAVVGEGGVSYVTVGACPKCGAPIYAQSPWHSIMPPPSIHSCQCHGGSTGEFTTDSTATIPSERPSQPPTSTGAERPVNPQEPTE